MKKFLNYIRKLQRNNFIYIIPVLQALSIIAYIFASKGLEKPAGFLEAISFLFNNVGQYVASILLGLVAWALFTIWLISLIAEIPIVIDALDDDYFNNYFENIPTWKVIVNIVLGIILLILNILFLKYLAVLLVILIILMVIIAFFTMNN